jgi:hypothetical protein
MNRLTNSLSFGALTALALPLVTACVAACGGGNDNLPPPPPPPPPTQTTPLPPPVEATADAAPPAPPPAPPVTLLPGTSSPDPTGAVPTIHFISPTPAQRIADDKVGDFAIKLDVKNWQTAAGSSHDHLILDGRPYKRVNDPKQPVTLSELLKGDTLAEGQHVLVAFPSRANHESVKTKGAVAVTEFYVGKSKDHPVDLKAPMLIYSRPTGEYKGEAANHVLLDFQLVNDTLADGKDHVHVSVTGPGISTPLTADATKFGAPYYLDNLQNGSYTVKLDLLKGDGSPVPGPWNTATRSITIDHSAPPEAPPPAAASSAPPAAKPPAH